MGNVGCGINVDVNHLLSQMEELKLKVAANEERICLYEEQIMELKMMLAKEEHHFQANSKVVVELRKKLQSYILRLTLNERLSRFYDALCSFAVY